MARKDHNTILPLYSRLRPLLSQPPWRRGPAQGGWQHRLCRLYRLWPSLPRPSGQGEARARPPATSTCHCTAAADAALTTGLRCTLPLSGEDVRCRRSSAPEFVLNESFSTWTFLFFVPYPPALAFRQKGEMGSPPRQAGGFGRATCHLHPPVNINALLPTLHQLARR